MNKVNGFSLIEMMVTLGVAGILALVAYPSYQDSAMKTRRTDGIAASLAVQVAQEKFRGNCLFYAQNLGTGNVCGGTAGTSTAAANTTSSEGFYTISIEAGTASGNAYTIVATPIDIQAGDTTCSPMKITFNAANPNGLKTPANCW